MDGHKRTLLIGILMISIKSFINPCRGNESSARSIDLSSAWRPIHFTQQAPQSHLISISSLDNANKLQLYQIAQYNAQILQKLKDMEEALRRSNIKVEANSKTSNGNTNSLSHAFDHPNVRQSHVAPTLGAPLASPTTLKHSPQFHPFQNHIKPPFPIHTASSNVVYNSVPHHSLNIVPNGYSAKPSAYVTGKPMYYGKLEYKSPAYYSSTPKMPILIKQTPVINNYPGYYRAPTMYRDPIGMTTPIHPVMNKLQAHMAVKQRIPIPVQHIKIGNASIPAHIISSLSIFGNALQQIRDSKQKETILNHLLRNITTTASSFIPASVQATIASTINSFPTILPSGTAIAAHDLKRQPNIKPIPVTMGPPTIRGPTVISYGDAEVQPTISMPKQRPIFNNFQDPITPKPTSSSYDYSLKPPSTPVKDGHHFLPTIPSQDNPVNMKSLSPLQDANRFSYKTNTPSTTFPDKWFTVTAGKPVNYKDFTQATTENAFNNFDFPQLSSSYNKQNFNPKKKQNLKILGEEATTKTPDLSPNHSFFTMEDAVTSIPDYYLKTRKNKDKHRNSEERKPPKPTTDAPFVSTELFIENNRLPSTTAAAILSTTTTINPSTMYFDAYPTEAPTVSPRPRNKLRRKKPRPQFVNRDHEMDSATSNIITNSWEHTRNRHRIRGRPSVDEVQNHFGSTDYEAQTEPTYKSSERIKFPSRNRFTTEYLTSSKPTIVEEENIIPSKPQNPVYKHTSTTTEKEEEIPTTTSTSTTHFNEETTADEHVKHRLKYRYKSRARPTLTTTTTSTTEGSVEDFNTDNPLADNEDKMVLKLLNSVASGPSSTEVSKDESLITTTLSPANRIKAIVKFDSKNRPRFSVKDYRNRLLGSTSTTTKTTDGSTTPSTLFRNRNKYNKEELESKLIKRISTTTKTPRSTLPPVPRRKTLPTRLENINRFRLSTSTGASTTVDTTTSAQTTPMSIKLRNSYQIRTRNKLQKPDNVEKPNSSSNENDITDVDDDELVRSESNHYSDEDSSNEIKSPAPTEIEAVTEKSHETSIMKIAKDDHSYRSHVYRSSTTPSPMAGIMSSFDNESNILQRVSDLTVTSGQNSFNSVNTKHVSRKVPNYFTIATEDPILPIEAFFPNVINKD